MIPKYDGLDLYNAICTVQTKKYKVTTIYNDLKQKMTYMIESKSGWINGEFMFRNGVEGPVSYSAGAPVTEHKPINQEIQLSDKNKQKFVRDFITFRLSYL